MNSEENRSSDLDQNIFRQPVFGDLLADYRPIEGLIDEMVDASGAVRPHWQGFLSDLGAVAADDLANVWKTAERLISENGTTYNVYGGEGAAARPWRMDPVPFLVSSSEWSRIEAGLIQRAKLLNAIVDDTYGEQSLLSEGLLPAPLIFGNPNFLRPLRGLRPKGGVHLNFLAFDIARAADNRWWVLSDRTQAPSGVGYALENRVVLARALPEIFRNAQVQRLAEFFQALSDNLIAQTGKEDPLAVLMTPGPFNETYFEHAYLAQYLGFPLVEGADLTVRDSKVYLKTLNGLRQVDLIFRRVDGDFCDPLELRTESLLGVAGLVSAVRAGNVVVANSLGSGVVECQALMSFLPGLSRKLLGENLLMPSVATWWCGQEKERDYVVENIERLVLRPTFSDNSIVNRTPDIASLGEGLGTRREDIVNLVNRRGFEYFGQESLTLSTTPVWRGGGMEPRPMALRIYVCADGDGYRVMPGGLTRTTDGVDPRALSMQKGDASNDTWVLSEQPISTFSKLRVPGQAVALRRSGTNLPSRVADNLFWLGRYAERIESSVRLLRSLILRLAGEAGAGDDPQTLTRLTDILVELGYLNRRTARRAVASGIRAVEREVATLLFDRGSTSGLLVLLDNLTRTASMVRDRLSLDSWRTLNGIAQHAFNQSTITGLDVEGGLALLNQILEELAAFSGMQMENMTRSLGWRLLDMGRRVERATYMAKLIREIATEGDPAAGGGLDLLLELGDSTMTYRARYLSTVQLAPVIDLLLTDETNPRSVVFQANAMFEHIQNLPDDGDGATLTREEHLLVSMSSQLRLVDISDICSNRNRSGRLMMLSRLVETMERQTYEVADELARRYFSHVLPTRSATTPSMIP